MIAPTNYITLRIINLQGEIYQVVSTNEETTYYQGSWKQCIDYVEKIVINEFNRIALEALSPN